MEINRENLLTLIKNGIKREALSMSGLERQANVPRDTIRDFMRGKTQVLRADKLQKILRILEPQGKVQVTGIVGTGAIITPADTSKDIKDEVDCPPGFNPSDVVAVRIKGNAMLPVFHDGWVVYYSRNTDLKLPAISGGWQVPYTAARKTRSQPFAELLNKPCVIGFSDGKTMLGTLKRSTKGGYDLINHNAADVRNIKPKWAAKIIFIKTE